MLVDHFLLIVHHLHAVASDVELIELVSDLDTFTSEWHGQFRWSSIALFWFTCKWIDSIARSCTNVELVLTSLTQASLIARLEVLSNCFLGDVILLVLLT